MSSLTKLVRDRDKLHNTPRQLEVTERARERKLICIICRRSPNREQYRARWLAANPLPRRYCGKRCSWMPSSPAGNSPDHKRWHISLYVSANMPSFEAFTLAFKCPDCGGQLVSVEW
jgi:hypothetical protein